MNSLVSSLKSADERMKGEGSPMGEYARILSEGAACNAFDPIRDDASQRSRAKDLARARNTTTTRKLTRNRQIESETKIETESPVETVKSVESTPAPEPVRKPRARRMPRAREVVMTNLGPALRIKNQWHMWWPDLQRACAMPIRRQAGIKDWWPMPTPSVQTCA